MAKVVGVTPAQLTEAGRDDAAAILADLLRPAPAADTATSADAATATDVTDDADDDDVTAVVAALFGPEERRVWAQVRRRLASTPAGRALFADANEAASWPPESGDGLSGGAPLELTDQARQTLDATSPVALFDDPAEITVWGLDKLPYRKRVAMVVMYREPVRPPAAARRAGLGHRAL